VVVAGEGLQGDTVKSVGVAFVVVDIFVAGKLPDHDGLVSGTGDQKLVVFIILLEVGGLDAGNPVTMTFEVTDVVESSESVFNSFLHFGNELRMVL